VHVRHTYVRTTVGRSSCTRTHVKIKRTACVARYSHKSYKARHGGVVKTTRGKKHKIVGVHKPKEAKKKEVRVKKVVAKNKSKKIKAKK